jgi:hypothetical protein
MRNFTNYFTNLKSFLFKKLLYGSVAFLLLLTLSSHDKYENDEELNYSFISNTVLNTNFAASDDFSSDDYAGGIGSWMGDWTETGDDDTDTGNDPTAGYTQITSGALQFDVVNGGDATISLDRSVDVSNANAITVSFDWVKGGDRRSANELSLDVQYSTDGGATFISGLFLDKEILYGRGEATSFSIPNLGSVSTLILRFEYDYDDTNNHPVLIREVTLSDVPELTAYAIQASCENNVAQNDAYLQLSSATIADRVGFSTGSAYTGSAYSSATDISTATFPFILTSGLNNPTTSQDYTIRVFNGSNTCFTDQVVTLENQDCNFGCECSEFLYMNDRVANETLKFRINSDGSLSMIGSPWLDNIAQPHGLGVDLDGNLYIAETPFSSYGDLFKIKPDGRVLDRKFYRTPKFPFQIFSNEVNKLFLNRDQSPEVIALDLCNITDGDATTDPVIGESDPGINPTGQNIRPWGAFVNPVTGTYWITDANSRSKAEGGFPIYKGNTMDVIGAGGANVFSPFPVPEHYRDRDGDGVADQFRPNGIAEDAAGNIYVAYGQNAVSPGNESYVAKYDANGNLIAQSAIDTDDTDGGWFDSRGVTVSENGFIYLSSEDGLVANGETCITVFEDDGMGNLVEIPAFRINAPAGEDTEAKTIYIAKSCCPTSTRSTFSEEICYDGSVDQQFFLGQILAECNGGSIGEGTWVQTLTNSNFTYDECDNSIRVNGSGCVEFTLSSDGTGPFTECGAFEITVEICANEAPTVNSIELDCNQLPAIIDLEVTSNAVNTTLQYSWEGPNGFTSTDEDPTLPEGISGEGDYSVTITDTEGCTATAMINADRNNCPVLPVELVTFSAMAMQDYIQLDWKTAAELNNEYFDIERSEDGKTFKAIGQVEGNGTTTIAIDYQYDDMEVEQNVNYYYRLKQVDTDGSFAYSNVETARIKSGKGELLVYPNPVGNENELTVELFVNQTNTTIELIGMQGQLIRTYQLNQAGGWVNTTLDISELESGTYFLKSSDGQVKRFVKLK